MSRILVQEELVQIWAGVPLWESEMGRVSSLEICAPMNKINQL
jgi:hypothetical protein